MKMELYNTSNRVRVIPKYRYNGTYSLQPRQAVEIEDYMTTFFKPYSKVGVVVRVKRVLEPVVVDEVTDTTKTGEVIKAASDFVADIESGNGSVDDIVSDTGISDGEDSGHISDSDIVSKVADDIEPSVSVVEYTEESLSAMPIKDLKVIAESLGVVIEDGRRKDPIVKGILEKVSI